MRTFTTILFFLLLCIFYKCEDVVLHHFFSLSSHPQSKNQRVPTQNGLTRMAKERCVRTMLLVLLETVLPWHLSVCLYITLPLTRLVHPIRYNSTFHVKGGAGRADVVDYDGSTNAGQRQAVCDALNIYMQKEKQRNPHQYSVSFLEVALHSTRFKTCWCQQSCGCYAINQKVGSDGPKKKKPALYVL